VITERLQKYKHKTGDAPADCKADFWAMADISRSSPRMLNTHICCFNRAILREHFDLCNQAIAQSSKMDKMIAAAPMSNINLSLAPDCQLDLKLTGLELGAPGITPAFGESLAEAAGVCLEDQNHSSPIPMQVSGALAADAVLEWEPISAQARQCWNDDDEATEHGAYGIAVLLVPQVSGLQVVERSKKGTGFDYWLGSATEEDSLFQNRARLEVSGIRNDTNSRVAQRVRKKLKQTERSDGHLPALVVVVEFSQPQSQIAKR